MAPEASFASDEEQFLETLESSLPPQTESRAEIASTPKSKISEEPIATQDTTSVAHLEPKPNPRPTHERLSSESPFPVHVPRTLRPISTANVPTPTPNEPPRKQPRVHASTRVEPEQFPINKEPTTVVDSPNTDVAAESRTSETPAQPKPFVADPDQARVPRPVHTEATRPDTAPIPRVDAPPRYSAEPSPPPALPVHLPSATGNATRQDQSRVHIGSLEVLVNNHPPVTPVRRAPAPSRTESLNLEKRYLDRFRLRH